MQSSRIQLVERLLTLPRKRGLFFLVAWSLIFHDLPFPPFFSQHAAEFSAAFLSEHYTHTKFTQLPNSLPSQASTPKSLENLKHTPASSHVSGTRPGLSQRKAHKERHSHSIVAGGLEVTSRTTRLTSGTEFVMRVEMRARTS